MRTKFLVYIGVVAVIFGISAGCSSNNEKQRSVVSVASVNFNTPVISDELEQGDSVKDENGLPISNDDFIAEDHVPMTFYNRPYNNMIFTEPGATGGDVVITDYHIRWTRADGGPVLPDLVGNTSIYLQTDEFTTVSVRMVTFTNKSSALLADLCYLSSCPNQGGQIEMVANISFTGHELGTERDINVEIQVAVSFVDLVIATEDD